MENLMFTEEDSLYLSKYAGNCVKYEGDYYFYLETVEDGVYKYSS